jgi:hypothetical protein
VISAQETGPLSLHRVWGSPNLGIISLIKTLITSWTFLEEQGNASTHAIKVCTRTSCNLEVGPPWQLGEVKLPVLPWICPLPLRFRDRQGSVVRVVMLTDFPSFNNILESISEF